MISGLVLVIAVYVIVILTLTEHFDSIQTLLFATLLTAITFALPLATPCCGNTGQIRHNLLKMTTEVAPSLH